MEGGKRADGALILPQISNVHVSIVCTSIPKKTKKTKKNRKYE